MQAGVAARANFAGVPPGRIQRPLGESCAGRAAGSAPCDHSDNFRLSELSHKPKLCARSDIDDLSELDHIQVKGTYMSDLARNPLQLGSIVRRARRKRDLTQTELGGRAGCRQETISLIERGNPATRIDTLLRVLASLELEMRIAPRSKGAPADIEDIF
jgi:HTH-type transcriptional regulator/antitoxin HipB